jgi:3D (Asp-Asp-Asp) domain-containing protein
MSSDDRNRCRGHKTAETARPRDPHKVRAFGTVRPVLGRRESRPALVLVAVSALLVAAVPASAGAGAGGQTSGLRGEQSDLAGRSRAAVLGLYSLDTRLARARAELASIKARATEVERERAHVAHDIAVARGVLRESQRQLGDHLRTLYEQGEPDAIAVLLGATSLQDAASRLDELERSAHLNHQAIEQSSSARRQLSVLAAKLAGRAAELRRLEASAERTAASLEAARAERIRYIASLRQQQQQLKAREIARIEATAKTSAGRSEAIAAQQPAVAPPAPSVTAPTGASTITVTATGYSLGGSTATGLPVGWGVVAVDPSVIPLGTRMTIPGYGEGIAADTGGGVQGGTIDLWFPTQAQALAWGRRVVTITLH